MQLNQQTKTEIYITYRARFRPWKPGAALQVWWDPDTQKLKYTAYHQTYTQIRRCM